MSTAVQTLLVFVIMLPIGYGIAWAMQRKVSPEAEQTRTLIARVLLIAVFGAAAWLLVSSIAN